MQLLDETDPFLNIPTREFDISNPPVDFNLIVDQMIALMYEKNAIGLAANQIGLDWRLFVMHTVSGPKVCINPSILKSGDIQPTREGCLSFPNLSLIINRPNFILAEYFNIEMEKKTEYFDKIEAVCFQHELDHINGITFTDRISSFQLKNALKKRKRLKSN